MYGIKKRKNAGRGRKVRGKDKKEGRVEDAVKGKS